METRSVQYGSRSITFSLEFADRKTLEISVLPDKQVRVKAPIDTPIDDIDARVRRRSRWISRQIRYFAQFDPRTPPRHYLSGETHLYMGRRYRLKVIEGDTAGVKLRRGFLNVTTADKKEVHAIKQLIDSWYLERARERLPELLEHCFARFGSSVREKPRLRIQTLSRRWGSLSRSGKLTLNRDLIRAPRECIEYVIVHELCHLEHADHSRAFYDVLERMSPAWRKHKHRLELTLA